MKQKAPFLPSLNLGTGHDLTMQHWSLHAPHLGLALRGLAFCRKQRDTELFSFCTDGKWSSGVRVEKDGTGLRQAWKRQIQQFNRVSPAAAAAIAEAYPSPSLLLQVSSQTTRTLIEMLLQG